MKLLQTTIRLEESQTGNTVKGTGAALTGYIKDNTESRPNNRRPAIVICPGGGYEYCSTREAEPVAMQFLAMDCQAFVLNYSTQPDCFPTALMELAKTVALIRSHAEEWYIDETKILVCGFSAGGHLAACLGVFWNQDFLSRPLGLKAEEIRPDGLILAYPVISSGEYAHKGSFRYLLGEEGSGADCLLSEDTRTLLSLEKQVGPHVPPVFMWHTDTDGTVPVENALLFAFALKNAGISLELHIFPKGRHGLALANEETDKDEDDGRGPNVVPGCQIWISLAREWLHTLFH